jgi:hypothetical protein
MPVAAKLVNGRYRVVEAATGKLAHNASGTPVDGKGHKTHAAASAQARAINAHLSKQGKI